MPLITTPVEWISTKPGPNSAPRPMMQLHRAELSLLKSISSGTSPRRRDHCMQRYRIMAVVPSVASVLSRARASSRW